MLFLTTLISFFSCLIQLLIHFYITTMVGCKIQVKKRTPEWIKNLLNSKFFESCDVHKEVRRNEKNMFCIDCNLCFCKHCVNSSVHCFHEWLQICKYVYHDVIRLQEIQKHLNCSAIQTYKINGEKAIHLNPRPQSKDSKTSKLKGSVVACEACGRHLQDLPNRFCSIACKVSIDADICKERKIVCSTQITKFDHLSSKESCYTNENESCISLTESSEVIQTWCSAALKPKKNLHKRKGIPWRAPLC